MARHCFFCLHSLHSFAIISARSSPTVVVKTPGDGILPSFGSKEPLHINNDSLVGMRVDWVYSVYFSSQYVELHHISNPATVAAHESQSYNLTKHVAWSLVCRIAGTHHRWDFIPSTLVRVRRQIKTKLNMIKRVTRFEDGNIWELSMYSICLPARKSILEFSCSEFTISLQRPQYAFPWQDKSGTFLFSFPTGRPDNT